MAKRCLAEEAEQEETVEGVQEWFARKVTYRGEPYTIDREQAMAVVSNNRNAIVVARAGSGKTRTIVAKMVYLIARRGVRPEEMIAFVFNSNAATEINARLSEMMVDGTSVVAEAKVAVTFHAFARRIVYSVGGKEKCGKILAVAKEDFVREVLRRMGLDDKRLSEMTGLMSQFVNRAQQRYLGEETSLMTREVSGYLQNEGLSGREREFVKLGLECYKRYHWYLLDVGVRSKLPAEFVEYGTDFNLIVAWAAKLIRAGRADALVGEKRHILIDEYQDFSHLFLSVVMAMRARVAEAKVFVVGDDWQAINRFAGSEVEYFKEFERYFEGDTRRYEISTNYRCDAEIVETARGFMERAMGEKGNFRAKSRRAGRVVVVNPREMTVAYRMTSYDKRVGRSDLVYIYAARRMVGKVPKKKTVQYIKTLARIIQKNRTAEEILLLHRNNETNLEGVTLVGLRTALKWVLVRIGVMTDAEFDAKVRLMTMHKSKGLEAEVVIILEADEGVIPKAHPDTRLFAVFGETEEVALDDQKRLFYVAMTRAKRRLYIIYNGESKKGGRKSKKSGGEQGSRGFIKYLGTGVEKDF